VPVRGRPRKLPEHVERAVVLDAAVVRFAEVGRDRATLDEISEACGVRKPSIYDLFGSKDDLYRAAVEHEVSALIDFFRVANAETAHLPLSERSRRRIDAALTRAEAHPHGFQLLTRARGAQSEERPDAGREMLDRLVSVMADNYRSESIAAGKPLDAGAELMARLFFSMADQVIAMRLADERWDRDALVDFLASFIRGGIAGVQPTTWRALEHRNDRAVDDDDPVDGRG
jgi:AcrR family transcriptional regulator